MVHPSLEPYVNAVRAEPATHPSLLSADERRAAYRETWRSPIAASSNPWNRGS